MHKITRNPPSLMLLAMVAVSSSSCDCQSLPLDITDKLQQLPHNPRIIYALHLPTALQLKWNPPGYTYDNSAKYAETILYRAGVKCFRRAKTPLHTVLGYWSHSDMERNLGPTHRDCIFQPGAVIASYGFPYIVDVNNRLLIWDELSKVARFDYPAYYQANKPRLNVYGINKWMYITDPAAIRAIAVLMPVQLEPYVFSV